MRSVVRNSIGRDDLSEGLIYLIKTFECFVGPSGSVRWLLMNNLSKGGYSTNIYVQMECASWYTRDDNLVQVMSSHGNYVLLNPLYSTVWQAIGNRISKNDLEESVLPEVSKVTLECILSELCSKKLISIADEDSLI